MSHFISLKLIDGGTVAVRPQAIDAVESIEADYQVVRVGNKAYEVLPGQFSLDRLMNHNMSAGVRVL